MRQLTPEKLGERFAIVNNPLLGLVLLAVYGLYKLLTR